MPEGSWPTAAALTILAVAAVPVTRWFARTVQRAVVRLTGSTVAAVYVYHALMLPGTVLHELCHLVVAWLLRVPAGGLSLVPAYEGPGSVRMGSVAIARVDPLRESLIGLAPLIGGVIAIVLITGGPLGLPSTDAIVASPAAALEALKAAPDAGLWLYLLVAIGNTMIPSASDRRAWVALLPVVGFAVAVYLGLQASGMGEAARWIRQPGVALGLALALTVTSDLVLGVPVGLLLLATERDTE